MEGLGGEHDGSGGDGFEISVIDWSDIPRIEERRRRNDIPKETRVYYIKKEQGSWINVY